MVTPESLADLLKYGEHLTLECKKAESTLPNAVWETYSAFANTVGGTILFGIEEHRKERDPAKRFSVVNIENLQARLKEFWDTVNNSTKVNINILRDADVGTCVIDGKTIIWIEVPQADYTQKPVYINGNPISGTMRGIITVKKRKLGLCFVIPVMMELMVAYWMAIPWMILTRKHYAHIVSDLPRGTRIISGIKMMIKPS